MIWWYTFPINSPCVLECGWLSAKPHSLTPSKRLLDSSCTLLCHCVMKLARSEGANHFLSSGTISTWCALQFSKRWFQHIWSLHRRKKVVKIKGEINGTKTTTLQCGNRRRWEWLPEECWLVIYLCPLATACMTWMEIMI